MFGDPNLRGRMLAPRGSELEVGGAPSTLGQRVPGTQPLLGPLPPSSLPPSRQAKGTDGHPTVDRRAEARCLLCNRDALSPLPLRRKPWVHGLRPPRLCSCLTAGRATHMCPLGERVFPGGQRKKQGLLAGVGRTSPRPPLVGLCLAFCASWASAGTGQPRGAPTQCGRQETDR